MQLMMRMYTFRHLNSMHAKGWKERAARRPPFPQVPHPSLVFLLATPQLSHITMGPLGT